MSFDNLKTLSGQGNTENTESFDLVKELHLAAKNNDRKSYLKLLENIELKDMSEFFYKVLYRELCGDIVSPKRREKVDNFVELMSEMALVWDLRTCVDIVRNIPELHSYMEEDMADIVNRTVPSLVWFPIIAYKVCKDVNEVINSLISDDAAEHMYVIPYKYYGKDGSRNIYEWNGVDMPIKWTSPSEYFDWFILGEGDIKFNIMDVFTPEFAAERILKSHPSHIGYDSETDTVYDLTVSSPFVDNMLRRIAQYTKTLYSLYYDTVVNNIVYEKYTPENIIQLGEDYRPKTLKNEFSELWEYAQEYYYNSENKCTDGAPEFNLTPIKPRVNNVVYQMGSKSVAGFLNFLTAKYSGILILADKPVYTSNRFGSMFYGTDFQKNLTGDDGIVFGPYYSSSYFLFGVGVVNNSYVYIGIADKFYESIYDIVNYVSDGYSAIVIATCEKEDGQSSAASKVYKLHPSLLPDVPIYMIYKEGWLDW